MNAVAPFNFELVFRSNVGQGKAGLTDIDAALKKVTAGAGEANRATGAQAAALDKLAQSAAKAALTQKDLVAAELQAVAARQRAALGPVNVLAQQQQTSIFGIERGASPSAAALHTDVIGLGRALESQADKFEHLVIKSREYQQTLNDVRASMNPLFAASQQYEQQLDRIAQAEKMGAISALEAAAARQRAVGIIAPGIAPGARGGAASHHTANVAAQGFDIGVTAAMGMNPVMIGIQQGPQLAQVAMAMGGGMQAVKGMAAGFAALLNPMTLAIIGLTTFGAAAIQWLTGAEEGVKTFSEGVGDLSERVDAVAAANRKARGSVSDLRAEFGSAADAGRVLYEELAKLERLAASFSLDKALKALPQEFKDGWVTVLSAGIFGEQRREMFDIGRWDSEGMKKVLAAQRGAEDVAAAEGTEARIAALEDYVRLYREVAAHSGEFSETEVQGLQDIHTMLARLRALVGQDENAAGKSQAGSITRDLGQRVELEAAALSYGQQSAEVRSIEARHEREALASRLEGLGLSRDDVEMREAMSVLAEVHLAIERAATEERRQQLQSRQDELASIRLEISLIGVSNVEAERAKAIAEAELEIRDEKLGLLDATLRRVQAIAAAEARADLERARAVQQLRVDTALDGFDMRIRRTDDPVARATLEAQKEYVRQLAQNVPVELAAAEAARVRARAMDEIAVAQQGWLKGQAERIADLQLEIALVGQSADVRTRILALVQAEKAIREQGLTGEAADRARRNAEVEAELTRTLEAQTDAWRRVQSAGESAIDGILDKLRSGDIREAISEMAEEIGGMFFDLQVRNPIKNAILGTNLGTMDDVGGLGGIWGRLTGRNEVDQASAVAMGAAPVSSMSISATQVILQAGALDLTGLSGLAANLPTAHGSVAGLGGSGNVQAQVWSFFAQKGLAPHQIAGIMGNISAESSFDPRAVGDGGTSFGLFQHHAGRGQGLLGAVGGQAALGDVRAQLEYVWRELMTTESAAMAKLMASTTVRGATEAFVGFERPQGYSAANPAGAMHFDRRLAAAEAAMGKFETATVTAQQQLGQLGTGAAQLGTGLQSFGSSVAGVIQSAGAQRGLGGMVVGGLLTGLGQMAGIPGFDRGGWTGPGAASDVAGLVHAEEFVFDAPAVRRIGVGNLESIRRGAMRGYQSGGYVSAGRGPALPVSAPAASAGGGGREVTFNINVSGTGNSEIREGVNSAIAQAFDLYEREALPGRVKSIVNDRWGG